MNVTITFGFKHLFIDVSLLQKTRGKKKAADSDEEEDAPSGGPAPVSAFQMLDIEEPEQVRYVRYEDHLQALVVTMQCEKLRSKTVLSVQILKLTYK